ncbi:MAG: ATP synthase F1 subunit epsilon [Barnesiella sp.]|nr:ATP synthase F1 subunit epsilon [Bacteroidales bacterium]MBD5245685.1 ATP synthase F1 subunit epsilon [Barnesiella sp.]MBD5248934.1 ATP synthase F1 subunit epsilon [Barnesiella sp.]
MTLKIISAQEVVFQGEVTSVTLPGEMGSFTVLKNHASLVSILTAGEITYISTDGGEHKAAITGGIVDVDNNIVSVCTY